MNLTLGMLASALPALGAPPAFVGQQGGGTAGTVVGDLVVDFALTGGLAAQPIKGDIVIVALNWVVPSDQSFAHMAPQGYTQLANLYANDTYDTNLYVGYKVMGDVPDTSVNLGNITSSVCGVAYSFHVWRGVDPLFPIDAGPVNLTGTSTGYPVSQSITPITQNAICIFAVGAAAAQTTPVPYTNSSLENLATGVGADDTDAYTAIGSLLAPEPVAVDDGAWRDGPTSNTSNSNANCYFALRPLGSSPKEIFFVGGSTGSQNNTNGLQTKPLTGLTGGARGSVQPGDIVFLICADAGTVVTDVTVTSPGWNKQTSLYANDTRDSNMHMFWKIMSDPADTEVIFQRTTGTVNDGSWIIYAIGNVDPVTPFDVNGATNTGIDSGQPNPPGVTPVNEGSRVLAAGAATGGLTGSSEFTSSDLNNFITVKNDDGSVAAVAGAGLKDWVSGLSDPAAFGGGSTSTSDSWCARTLALRKKGVTLPTPPANTVIPAISGVAYVGGQLTCSTGSWTGYPSPTYGYQWKADGVDISGATAQTYTCVAGDVGADITCTVTATNASGSASATADPVGPVTSLPPISFVGVANAVATSITLPAHQAGDLLVMFADNSSVSPTVPSGWIEWSRNEVSADRGVVAYKIALSSSEVSGTWTNAYALSALVYRNAVPGASANAGGTVNWPALTLQDAGGRSWVLHCGGSAGSTSGPTLPSGETQRVGANYHRISDTNDGVTSMVAKTNSIANCTLHTLELKNDNALTESAPVNTGAPTIAGGASVGSVLTRTAGTWSGYPAPTLTGQWKADGVDIAGQTGATYTIAAGDVGKTITYAETATNTQGSASATSNGVLATSIAQPNLLGTANRNANTSFAHEVVAGTACLIVRGIVGNDTNSAVMATCTWNGVAMTRIAYARGSAGSRCAAAAIFFLMNPTPGTGNVVIAGAATDIYSAENWANVSAVRLGGQTGDGNNASSFSHTVSKSNALNVLISAGILRAGTGWTPTNNGVEEYDAALGTWGRAYFGKTETGNISSASCAGGTNTFGGVSAELVAG